ncbi:hypothetical protein POTOM_045941 [Populus tomentosa]|uniref:RING-type E3 ubiquitin transferase n=1 Tax=Populus tomentosa TaxID=118781 RepID=A0A8X7YUM5_POPTO|nr:hypothetical protein POTOM_045941 [Populus tomentosa]
METSVVYHTHRLFLDTDSGMPPSNQGDRNSSDYILGTGANFDGKVVMVLVALLFALVCAFGINSIARCATRNGYRIGFETSQQSSSRLAAATNTELKKSALGQIPVVPYKSGLNIQVMYRQMVIVALIMPLVSTTISTAVEEANKRVREPENGPVDNLGL